MYKNYVKRPLDIFLASIIFTILSPISIIITLVLFYLHKGNPFYFQSRPGLNGVLFKVVKFKSMKDKDELNASDFNRLTGFGRILRGASLDEIPQLVNVIKGDMSLIGPRPLLIEYLPLYNKKQNRRHEVRPGLTGWAQVNGRNSITWQQKFDYDVWYVENISFWLDMKIFLKSILRVIKRKDINATATMTMKPFLGEE